MKILNDFKTFTINEGIQNLIIESEIDTLNDEEILEAFSDEEILEAFSMSVLFDTVKRKLDKNAPKVEKFKKDHKADFDNLKDKYEEGGYSKDKKGFKSFYKDNKQLVDNIWHYMKPLLGGFGIIVASAGGGLIYFIAYILLTFGILDWMGKDFANSVSNKKSRDARREKKANKKGTVDVDYEEVKDEIIIKALPENLSESLLAGYALYLVGVYAGVLLLKHIKNKKYQKELIKKIAATDDPVTSDKLKKQLSKYKADEAIIVKEILEKEKDLKKRSDKLSHAEKAEATKKVDKYKKEIETLEKEIKNLKAAE